MPCPAMLSVIMLWSSRGIGGITRSGNCLWCVAANLGLAAPCKVCSSKPGFGCPLHSPVKVQVHRPMAHCRPALAGAGAFEATIQHLRSLLSERDRQLGRLEAEVAMLRAGRPGELRTGDTGPLQVVTKRRSRGRGVPADQSNLADLHGLAGACMHRAAGPLQVGACAARTGAAELWLSLSSQGNGITKVCMADLIARICRSKTPCCMCCAGALPVMSLPASDGPAGWGRAEG